MRNAPPRPGFIGAVLRYFGARRALLPFVASVGYLLAIAVRVDRGEGARAWGVGGVALAIAFVAAGPRLPGNGLRDDGRRKVGLVAYALWGLALVLASLGSNSPNLWQDIAGGVAALGVSVVGAVALSRVRGGHGIADSLPRSERSLLAVTTVLLALAFGLAFAASAEVLRRPRVDPWDPFPHDAHAMAAGAALLILAGSTWETLRMRRLVLGAGDRAFTSLGVLVATGLAAVGWLILQQGATDRVLRLALALAAALVTYVSTEGDAETLSRRGRRAVTLLVFGGPAVLLGGLAAEGPGRSAVALLITGVVALVIGSAVALLEQPLRRAEGHLLDAVEEANAALVRADPETSIRDALTALRTLAGTSNQSPELWSLDPPGVLTIDGAGYAHERAAPLPPLLLEIAKGEPEATVRTELLEALVVRRPDLRPLARWMDERGALSATLVTREGEIEGVLVLPRGARHPPLSLEEVRAVKRLADAFSGASAAHAALARSLERERVSTKRAEEALERVRVHEAREWAVEERGFAATSRLAEGASGPYAPAARVAFDAIEARIGQGSHMVVLGPGGTDVLSYVAKAHLAGPRRRDPFLVLHCAAPVDHDVARWVDPRCSPLSLADGGLCALEDAVCLPIAVQRVLGEALAQRRAPWEGAPKLDLSLVLTATGDAAALRQRLDPSLVMYIDDALLHPIAWPHLRERGEDLRSLLLAGLVREGMRLRGEPLGIEDGAYERLADHPFAGENSELDGIVQRLALRAEGDRVRLQDVVALGLE